MNIIPKNVLSMFSSLELVAMQQVFCSSIVNSVGVSRGLFDLIYGPNDPTQKHVQCQSSKEEQQYRGVECDSI